MRIGEHQGQTAARTSDQILGEIRDYCRATQTAESTFGRLVVNDGKLVSRLRDGARITTGTLDKGDAAGADLLFLAAQRDPLVGICPQLLPTPIVVDAF